MNYHNELNKYFKNNINSLFNDINLYDVKKDIDFIVDSFSKKPWIKQKEIFKGAEEIDKRGFFIGIHLEDITRKQLNLLETKLLKISEI